MYMYVYIYIYIHMYVCMYIDISEPCFSSLDSGKRGSPSKIAKRARASELGSEVKHPCYAGHISRLMNQRLIHISFN